MSGTISAPFAGKALRQRLEVARVAGQAVQAQQRRFVCSAGIIAVMERQPVRAFPLAFGKGRFGHEVPRVAPTPCAGPGSRPLMARCAPNRKPPPIVPIRKSSDSPTGSPTPSSRRAFRCTSCASATAGGTRRSGWRTFPTSSGSPTFGRFEPLPGNLPQPLALRYHGHQFRVYNPEIGDGRGFTFAQLRDGADRLLDLGTKGSGLTPYSRTADGRLTLKGAVREILATEMLEALGVNTSKTFSVIETGEELHRGDEPSPTRSAVLVRLSHSHIRIGTFQRLRALEEDDHIRQLVDYCLEQFPGPLPPDDAPGRDEPAAS